MGVLAFMLACLAFVAWPDVRGTVRRMDPNEKTNEDDRLREEEVTIHDRLEDGAVEDAEIAEELREG